MENRDEQKSERRSLNYEALQKIILQNISKTKSRTFAKYTKQLIKQYIQNPYSNINNIRNVSAFLARNSMIYKKILAYYAQMPLFYYNLIYKPDFSKGVDYSKMIKAFQQVSSKLQEINMPKEFSTVIATALRDGVY